MENKDKQKKNHDKAHRPKAPLKDLQARKDADKVQGGTVVYGPET